jgi:hypothetical protein
VKNFKIEEKQRRAIIYPGVDFDQRITPFSEDRPLQVERVPVDDFINDQDKEGDTNYSSADFGDKKYKT